MDKKIKIKRGLKANLPVLSEGEQGFCTDTSEFFIGGSTGNVQIANKEYVDSQLAKIVTMASFPVIVPEIDDTARLQRANAYATLNNQLLDLGRYTYNISSPIQFTCSVDGKLAKIIANEIHETAVLIGYADTTVIKNKYFYLPNIENSVLDWADGSIGAVIQNVQTCYIYVNNITGFQTNLAIVGNVAGNSYNNIFIASLMDGKINLSLYTIGTGWVNENNLFFGRLGHSSSRGTNVSGCRHIKIYSGINTINNNSFYKACFEGNTKEYDLEMVNASYNHFYSSRWESIAPKILFDEISAALTSSYNVFMFGYKSENVVATESAKSGANTFYNGRASAKGLGMKAINFSSNSSPCFEIYDAAAKLGNLVAGEYLVSMSGNSFNFKRKTDAHPRIVIDSVNGLIKVGNGASPPVATLGSYGPSAVKFTGGLVYVDGTWDGSRITVGSRQEWYDASGNKRAKNGTPSNDTDGVIISANPVP